MPVRVGTSFSPRRCSRLGLPVHATFRDVLGLGFGIVRVSAYWDEIRRSGYAELDWLLDTAQAAGQSVVLTVGMKAMQWPEFYLPPDARPDPDPRGRLGLEPRFAAQVLEFVSETVARYRGHPEVVAWQVENEPFNRSGPQHWWIDPRLVRSEMEAVRALDQRPIILNAFSHFDSDLDAESRPRRGPFGLWRLVPEKAILELLGASDILGLDVYTAIGIEDRGRQVIRRAAPDWAETAGRRLRAARRHGNAAWIIEAQAEPWESSRATEASPLSLAPEDVGAVCDRLVGAGYSTILLWGCEYWLWRAAEGDGRWLAAARQILTSAPRSPEGSVPDAPAGDG